MEIETKRSEKDGIQMAVTAQLYRKKLKALFDSGATRSSATPYN